MLTLSSLDPFAWSRMLSAPVLGKLGKLGYYYWLFTQSPRQCRLLLRCLGRCQEGAYRNAVQE